MFKLCICIPTLNRANYIGETLDSICPQLSKDVEIVIVDGGSNDGTEGVVAEYMKKHSSIRYCRREKTADAPSNAGFDRDCSHAVELANAEYCWLMTDDDVLLPGAVRDVVSRLDAGHDLLVASCEVRDQKLERTLLSSRPGLKDDVVFQPSQWAEFFRIAIFHLTFVGAVIIRRSTWMERDPSVYFGSGFVHVGVVFGAPLRSSVQVIAKPLVVIRNGNAQWTSRGFEIFMFQWPQLVWSFPGVADAVKRSVLPREPWRLWRVLLLQRAYGRYSTREYQAYLRGRLASPVARALSNTIARIPQRLLYVPAWIFAHLKYADRRFFLFNLDAGMRR